MESTLTKAIVRECTKLINRHHRNLAGFKYRRRAYEKKTGRDAAPEQIPLPKQWALGSKFNPFKVRPRASYYARSLSNAIRSDSYLPNPHVVVQIPKLNGGYRGIAINQIPDSALANVLFKRLQSRNRHLLSEFAFAYRDDRNTHHAVEHAYEKIRSHQRHYVLEYDFKQYFTSIRHDYLTQLINRFRLRISPRELSLITSFLRGPLAHSITGFAEECFCSPLKGIPQGNSLSLFLANLACMELDREIERTGAVFARFADDMLVMADSYSQACDCAEAIIRHGERSGAQINLDKSPGLQILSNESQCEMRSTSHVEFLGFRITPNRIALKENTKSRIKQRISRIINQHLILYPSKGLINKTRICGDARDWDLVTCLNTIRRYIYGRITEEWISSCLNSRNHPLKVSRSVAAYYVLVTDGDEWREMDGWLVDVLLRALRARYRHIEALGISTINISRNELLNNTWYHSKIPNETSIPSFHKAWRYYRKIAQVYGLQQLPPIPYNSM